MSGAELEAEGDVEWSHDDERIYINGGVLHMFKSLAAAMSHWLYFEVSTQRIMACRVEDKDIVAWGIVNDVCVRRCTVLEEVVL